METAARNGFFMEIKGVGQAMDKIVLLEEAIAATKCGVTIADASDPEMPLVYINGAFAKITGYPVEDVIGRNCRFLQGENRDQAARKEIRDALENGKDLTVLLENYRQDGTHFWNELHLSPVFKNGQVTHFVGIQNDVTEEVEAKRDLERSHQWLARANQELKESNAAKDKLLGMAAHDLRGPLGAIKSLIELSRDGSQEEAAELLEMAHSVADHSLQIVNDILDLSAIKSGTLEIERKEVDIAGFIDRFSHLAEIMAKAKDIGFAARKEIEVDKVLLDEERISQVLNNLLTNAIKYSERGSQIVLKTIANRDRIIFEMIDEGIGIRAEDLPLLFEEFQRTGSTPTEGESSTGLGLAIVKRILDLHGGTIEVESEVGKGSCFRVILPV
jgi:hypothetical protein